MIVVPPWGTRIYDRQEWRDAFVVVGSGAIELESEHGVRRRYETSALLALRDRRLKRIVNPAGTPAMLLAITRGHRVDAGADRPSTIRDRSRGERPAPLARPGDHKARPAGPGRSTGPGGSISQLK